MGKTVVKKTTNVVKKANAGKKTVPAKGGKTERMYTDEELEIAVEAALAAVFAKRGVKPASKLTKTETKKASAKKSTAKAGAKNTKQSKISWDPKLKAMVDSHRFAYNSDEKAYGKFNKKNKLQMLSPEDKKIVKAEGRGICAVKSVEGGERQRKKTEQEVSAKAVKKGKSKKEEPEESDSDESESEQEITEDTDQSDDEVDSESESEEEEDESEDESDDDSE